MIRRLVQGSSAAARVLAVLCAAVLAGLPGLAAAPAPSGVGHDARVLHSAAFLQPDLRGLPLGLQPRLETSGPAPPYWLLALCAACALAAFGLGHARALARAGSRLGVDAAARCELAEILGDLPLRVGPNLPAATWPGTLRIPPGVLRAALVLLLPKATEATFIAEPRAGSGTGSDATAAPLSVRLTCACHPPDSTIRIVADLLAPWRAEVKRGSTDRENCVVLEVPLLSAHARADLPRTATLRHARQVAEA